jgi:hypothetical protein
VTSLACAHCKLPALLYDWTAREPLCDLHAQEARRRPGAKVVPATSTGRLEAMAGRTVDQVAAAIGRPRSEAADILADLVKRGVAERGGNRYRLTDEADRGFGRLLREVERLERRAAA